jgi:hypothetical protein
MDNISQRLGLVIHWVGLLIGVGIIIFIIAGSASHHLQTREYYGNAYKSECQRILEPTEKHFTRTQFELLSEEGDCVLSYEHTVFGDLRSSKKPYRRLGIHKPSFKRFIDSSINEIFRPDALVFLAVFLFGWLFRFILAGKVHILPWKK